MLIIDIETKPNKELEELFRQVNPSIEDKDVHKKMAVHQDFNEIVCIGIKQIGTEQVRMLDSIVELGKPAWQRLLVQMDLVTFNGKRFDLPVIIKQGLRMGIELPYKRLAAACKPWGYGERHIDIMETIAYDNKWISLDTYLQVYCGMEKDTKGADFFEKASVDEIKKHCEEDLHYTEKLYNFFKPVL